MEVLIKLIEFN